MRIIYSSKFEREYRKLSPELKAFAKKKEKIFRKNPFAPRVGNSQTLRKVISQLGFFYFVWL
jgi:mRNA-degrading endonuclease RelE of RelBE toxin-antitoxin system